MQDKTVKTMRCAAICLDIISLASIHTHIFIYILWLDVLAVFLERVENGWCIQSNPLCVFLCTHLDFAPYFLYAKLSCRSVSKKTKLPASLRYKWNKHLIRRKSVFRKADKVLSKSGWAVHRKSEHMMVTLRVKLKNHYQICSESTHKLHRHLQNS